MKQILQNLGSGETILADVPAPLGRPGHLLIRTQTSLVSLGTERMLVSFGQANLLEKARQQPERVRQVLQKVRTDGLLVTIDAVRAKLDQPLPLGYCNAGTVLSVGAGVTGFSVGDRVVSNGPHAEIVCVPRNLCCRIPDAVAFEQAPYAIVAAIALQGIRLAAPTVGETVVVVGLGLIGLLAVQILRASGCRVLGTDFDVAKCAIARTFGAETVALDGSDPVMAANVFSRGRGADAVIITASTKSSKPVSEAARMCRKRGRIVLVGEAGLELNRAEFYDKELSFQVSCSYGPGRHDPGYEQGGHDYPIGFVRWTEQRNFEAALDLLDAGAVNTSALTSHRFPIDRALGAYELVAQGSGLGILLQYPAAAAAETTPARIITLPKAAPARVDAVVVGMIGAGNYSGQTLLPVLASTGARLRSIVSSAGVTAAHLGRKFGFEQAGTDAASVFADPEINTVLVTTRHDSHARFVIEGLRAGKRVFVEKPLALTDAELDDLEVAWQAAQCPFVQVGFNRRFAPHIVTMKRLLAGRQEPKTMIMTVNAGGLPGSHWTVDPLIGGGRIVGEGCHFIDLLGHLAGAPIVAGKATFMRVGGSASADVASLQLRFADGSIGTVHYLANGSKDFPKERLEVFCGGGVLLLDNFRELRGFGWPGFRKQRLGRQDKGHGAQMQAMVAAVRAGNPSPVSWEEVLAASRWSLRLASEE